MIFENALKSRNECKSARFGLKYQVLQTNSKAAVKIICILIN